MLNEWDLDEWQSYATNVGLVLQRAREQSGYSQEYVAGNANITVYTYRKLEHGQSNPGSPANPRLKTLLAICRVLDITLDELAPSTFEAGTG